MTQFNTDELSTLLHMVEACDYLNYSSDNLELAKECARVKAKLEQFWLETRKSEKDLSL